MTGEQFVKLCYEEKKTILAEYFNPNSSSVVGKDVYKRQGQTKPRVLF